VLKKHADNRVRTGNLSSNGEVSGLQPPGLITVEHKTRVFSAVCWPFGKRVMELLILDKKERGAESQYYSGESGESRG